MRRILAVVALSFLAVGTCAAQEPVRVEQVTVNVGEAVTIALDPDRAGEVSIIERRAAPDEDKAASSESAGGDSAPAVANMLRIRLERMSGLGMMMSIENRSDQLLRYRARIESGRRSARTSVCPVIPKGSGFESWPGSFDRVVLSEFRLERVSEGQEITLTCE
jgi:hypothetical protein